MCSFCFFFIFPFSACLKVSGSDFFCGHLASASLRSHCPLKVCFRHHAFNLNHILLLLLVLHSPPPPPPPPPYFFFLVFVLFFSFVLKGLLFISSTHGAQSSESWEQFSSSLHLTDVCQSSQELTDVRSDESCGQGFAYFWITYQMWSVVFSGKKVLFYYCIGHCKYSSSFLSVILAKNDRICYQFSCVCVCVRVFSFFFFSSFLS